MVWDNPAGDAYSNASENIDEKLEHWKTLQLIHTGGDRGNEYAEREVRDQISLPISKKFSRKSSCPLMTSMTLTSS